MFWPWDSYSALHRKKELESEIGISYSSFTVVEEKYNCCTMLGTQINPKHIVYLLGRNFNSIRKSRDQMVNCFRILHKKSVKLAKRNCRSCPTILKIQRCHKLKPLLFRLKRSVVMFVLGEFLLANSVML